MSDPPRGLVEELARDVVSQVSPAELPLFRATAAQYFADPRRATSRREGADETLGFGAEAAVLLVGPFALELVKGVLTRLLGTVGNAAADGLASRLRRALAGDKPAPGPAVPERPADAQQLDAQQLDAQQLALVRRTAADEARRLTLPEADASRLADAVVAALATRAASPEGRG
jgi:hypothetical protein